MLSDEKNQDIKVRKAVFEDIPAIKELIKASSRFLAKGYYSFEQIEAALKSAWGVDSQLIFDATYFVSEYKSKIVGCGGWSRRRTLFGGDQQIGRSEELLDPQTDPARIRAFFIHPEWARKGIGRIILSESEKEAQLAGFRALELVATLSGQRFYESLGFQKEGSKSFPLQGGIEIEFISMGKRLNW